MNAIVQHLPAVPIVVPLVVGALLLLLGEAQRAARVTLALASLVVQLSVAILLLYSTTDAVPDFWTEGVGVYALGGWPAPFGIVLVVDRLSGMMLTLTAIIAVAVHIYALASWDRPAHPFYALYQFLLMGLNGAFLTGDLFNLFVFFEILLAASYGLTLRGVGAQRVGKALHYIAANLAASLLFLLGVAVIYGTVGTLNMAELFGKVAALQPAERTLFDAGAALLGIAFLVKAGAWPLNLWLPGAYSVAIAPVAAVFAMLTKVGIYAVLRVGTLMSQDEAAASMLGSILFFLGLATLLSGMVGMLATQRLTRLVAYSVIVSSGLLLASLGLGIEAITAPVLFYLSASVLTTAAFFMLTGMTDRTRLPSAAAVSEEPPIASAGAAIPEPTPKVAARTPSYVAFGVEEPDAYGTGEDVGAAIPAAMAFLGLMYVSCVLLVTGMPPLPGFIAKFTLLATALGAAPEADVTREAWALTIAVLATGFAAVIALTRVGIRLFWAGTARRTPRLRVLEAAPVAFLVMLCLMLSAFSGPAMTFFEATARSLHDPQTYIRTVLASQVELQSETHEP